MFEKNIHYSEQMEDAILGACLIEKTAFSRLFDTLKSEMFYSTSNQIVFKIIAEMFDNNLPIELTNVFDFICRKKGIKDFNGDNVGYFLTKKTNGITSTASIEYQALCLKQMWMDREVISLTKSKIDNTKDVLEKLSFLKEKISDLSTTTTTNDWKDMSQLLIGLYKHQDQMQKTGGKGKLTGFKRIDDEYGGFFDGNMVVIAARPSVGKSAFAGQIALQMSQKGSRVGIVSLEMNNNEIAARLSSLFTDLDFSKIFRGLYIDENERQNFYKKVNNSADLPIYVTDNTNVNISEIKAKAYQLRYKHGLDCLIIDYLQLIGSDSSSNRNRENEVATISRGVKILAKELNIPVIILAQLNREVDKRKGVSRYPQLSDLRESGAIEQDADVVIFLHSDFKSGHLEDTDGFSTEGKADIVVRKWRNGNANLIINLEFDGSRMKFNEVNNNNKFINIPAINNYNNDNPF